jgi:hypothetical protein
MSSKIETMGQLRQFLANAILGVRDGHIKVAEATAIKKMAEEINESMYAEVKVGRLQRDLEREVHQFGKLPLNESSSEQKK